MKSQLIHIYGPFFIHSYGLCIAIGLLVFVWLIQKHPKFKKMNLDEHFSTVVSIGTLAGLFGGRFLYMITSEENVFDITAWIRIWEGGLSILGCIIAILCVVPFYLRHKKIPILPFLDLVSIYTPLLQAISRVGCFFAGCCYGLQTTSFFSIVYSDPTVVAPLHVPLYPTQLYSSCSLLFIFLLMYFVLQHIFNRPGQLLMLYLMLESGERFFIDFWRGDRIMINQFLSINQGIALGLFLASLTLFVLFSLPIFRDEKNDMHEHI